MGGLTVARAIKTLLPHESILYVGDTKRCPYGVRPAKEIRSFVRQIGAWLTAQNVKLMVIACNTATAAALPLDISLPPSAAVAALLGCGLFWCFCAVARAVIVTTGKRGE